MKLITVGTVAFDSIATPFESREKVIGGAATYISMAAAYLTGECGVVSVVGDDFPESFMNELKSRGVDLAGLQIKIENELLQIEQMKRGEEEQKAKALNEIIDAEGKNVNSKK